MDRRKGTLWVTVVAVALTTAVGLIVRSTGSSSSPAARLVWSDEFSGRSGALADPATWRPAQGGDGWGNNELECYTPAPGNASLDGQGHLAITALYQPGHLCSDGHHNDYTSARLSTETLKVTKYGSIRVRAKLPTASGAWPAIWALGDDHSTVGWPRSGEIDIAEVIGRQPTVVHGTLHGPKADGKPYDLTAQRSTGSNLASSFHVFGTDWSPTSVSFSIDGHVYSRMTKAQVTRQGPDAWVFDKPFYFLLNLAVGGNWPGSPSTPTAFPQRMLVDYVRVYDR